MNISPQLKNHWLWQDKPFAKGQAWIDLLIIAANGSNVFRGKVYKLPKGQLITSEHELCERWGWSRTKVRSFLQLLREDSMLKIEAKSSKTILTIMQPSRQTNKELVTELDRKQKKEQVEIQSNPTDNQDKTEDCNQVKKQVAIQDKDSSINKINTEKGPKNRQFSFPFDIKENNGKA